MIWSSDRVSNTGVDLGNSDSTTTVIILMTWSMYDDGIQQTEGL
jgi:MFS-type transporter involved in bile tolerance (Atg22 family)